MSKPKIPAFMKALVASRAEAPTVWKGSFQFEWFRKFSFKERVAILFGSNIVVGVGVLTAHQVGKFQPTVIGEITHMKKASDHVDELLKEHLKKETSSTPLAQKI